MFVAGFVDLVSYPKTEQAFQLNRDEIKQFLPLPRPIPLNVEHLDDAGVGWVLSLQQVRDGLFATAIISSKEFLGLVRDLYPSSTVAQHRDHPLPENPEIEMLHTWLPSFSLSSVHPSQFQNVSEEAVFHHVSLCALGRRRGTVCVYGDNLKWVISKFETLNEQEKTNIFKSSIRINLETLPYPKFAVHLQALMSKAIDAGFIKDRLELLKTDRNVASVSKKLTYLKASSQDTVLQSLHQPAKTEYIQNMNPVLPGSSSEDLITVPKATFMSMLQTNLDTLKQTSTNIMHPPGAPVRNYMGFNVPDLTHVPAPGGSPHYYGWPHFPYYVPDEGVGYFSHGQYYPAAHPARPLKRKREFDDQHIFPGEQASIYKDIASMSKNLTELQEEIKTLKNTASMPHFYPPAAYPPNYLKVPIMDGRYPAPSYGMVSYLQPPPAPVQPTDFTENLDKTYHGKESLPPPVAVAPQNQASLGPVALPAHESSNLAGESAPTSVLSSDSGPKGVNTVNASVQPTTKNQLEKLFCQELVDH